MSIYKELDRVKERFTDSYFLTNKGLSNEVGFHIFCYKPENELIVRQFVEGLRKEKHAPYRIIERNLFEIFMDILDERQLTDKVIKMESRFQKDRLLRELQKIASTDNFLKRIDYAEHMRGDILLITGVGEINPYLRSHILLNAMQPHFMDIPVVMFYPGKYNGRELSLFGKYHDGNYYRAFNLL